jgi:hypothetical protein
MNLMPVLYTPRSPYTSHTNVFVPLIVFGVRAGAIAMLEWLSLRFVENAPVGVCIATGVIAVAVLAVLQFKDWLDFKGNRYFTILLSALLIGWIAISALGFWAYPPQDKILPTFPTADELAAAIAKAMTKTEPPGSAPTAPTPAAPAPSNNAALDQMRAERDSLSRERDALRAAVLPKSPWLHLDDAKYWQLLTTLKNSMAGVNSCDVTLEYNIQQSTPDVKRTGEIWGEVQPILAYAGWNLTQSNSRAIFPPGITIFVGDGGRPSACASHLKELLDGLNIGPVRVLSSETTPILQGCQNACIEVSLGKLERP